MFTISVYITIMRTKTILVTNKTRTTTVLPVKSVQQNRNSEEQPQFMYREKRKGRTTPL